MHKRNTPARGLKKHVQRPASWLTRRVHNMSGRQRLACLVVASVVLLSAIIPLVLRAIESRRYSLDSATRSLIGPVNQHLAAKVSYDSEKAAWRFNKPVDTSNETPSATLASQAGGNGKEDTSLYRTDFPRDPKKGVTFTDSQTELSFTMTPDFDLYDGQSSDGRLIYPLQNGAKLIYTAKNNGMKEDIVLPKFIDKELRFSYKLSLPQTLEAKILDDGSVGIFSADPVLFGHVSTASNMDAEKLKSARESGAKNHLLFAIPAPVIVQSGGKATKATAKFGLAGNILTVTARDMDKVTYPASVDPSIVVTSTSDFDLGTAEDNIDYNTDQINRGAMTGGGITAGWTSTSSGSITARSGGGSVAYNGYLYYVGGNTGSSSTEVNFAQINSNGTVGSWSTTTALPAARMFGAAVAHNGRMYVYGGYTSGTSALGSVIYATINSDGTLGSWTTASNSMSTAACRFGATVHDGYLYAAGGSSGTVTTNCGNSSATNRNDIQYAQILGNGDVGAWSTSAQTFTNARKDPGFAIYHGYAYITSGTTNGTTTYQDTQIAKVSSSGDVGSWRTASNTIPTNGKVLFGFRAYNGYLYINGGSNNLTGTLFARIFENGDIGPWTSSSTMSTGRYGHGFVIYKGYSYYIGGYTGSSYLGTTGYAKIDDPGMASTSISTTAFGAAQSAVNSQASVMYNNYLYSIGGTTGGTGHITQVLYAPINSDGTVGTWNTTSSLQTPVSGGTGLSTMAYTVYNNRVYVFGGKTNVGGVSTNVSSIQYATFNTDGTLGTWTVNATDLPFTTSFRSAAAYNGYVYMNGGTGDGTTTRIYRAQFNSSDGSVGSWTWDGGGSNPLPQSSGYNSILAYNKFLYVIGGADGATYLDDVQYAPINSDGTLGTWNTTSSLQTVTALPNAAIVNGYMYVVGGETTAAAFLTDVEYAKINSDGTLGTWASSADMPVTIAQIGIATWNDNIYIISGKQNGSRVKSVIYIKTRSGGGGVNGTWTTSGNTFTTARRNHGSAVYNGYIYVLGGTDSGNTYLTSVQYAKLNDDGTVGSWGSTTALPTAKAVMGIAAYKGYLFAFGGKTDDSTASSTVHSVPINSNGTLGAWSSITSLSGALASMSVTTHNGYVYLLGGLDSSSYNTVRYAQLNSDGTTGSWSTTTAFTGVRSSAGAVVNGDYLYVLGGVDGSGNYYKDVQYATINSNGTIGSWSTTTDMNYSRSQITPTILNGFLYIYGGYNGSNALDTVEYAPLNANGTIGAWTSGASQTNARYGHRVDMYNGYAYLTGGYNGSYYNNILYSAVQSTSHTATYSKLFDLGALYSLSSITYGGSLPGDTDAISYRAAGADGVFGSQSTASSIVSGGGVCTAGATRYVFVTIALDDSGRSAFADDNTSESYITHVTVTYEQQHAPTEKRLAHGKFFLDETLQPLDTCTSS